MTNNPINDVVLSGIDQHLPARQAEKDFFRKVDEIIQQSIEDANPRAGFDAMESLLSVSRVSGLALAKFIYTFKHQWKVFELRDSFEKLASEKLGLEPVTIKRYYRVWKLLVEAEIPKEYKDKLQLLSLKSLIPISSLVEQGFEIENKDWARLANAPDPTTVSKIIREIKGVEPKKGSLQAEWEAESKTLTAWKDGKPHFIYLTYDEKDEVVLAMLERLFGDGRVMEK